MIINMNDNIPMNTLDPLEKLILEGRLTPEQEKQRELAIQRLKERLSQIPWYREQVEKCGEEYWEKMYASMPFG